MPNKETKFKFIIQHGDQTVELTIEEAEKLYKDLSKIFDREPKTIWPDPIPYSPPPLNPWDKTPWNPVEPSYPTPCPNSPPNIIYRCNLTSS